MIDQFKRNIRIMINDETFQNISIITILLYPIILLLSNRIFNNSYIAYTIILYALPGLLITLLKNYKKIIRMLGIYIIIIVLNYVLHLGSILDTIKILIKNLITCYTIFVLVYCIKNKERMFEALKISGYILTILIIIYIALFSQNITKLQGNGLTIQLIISIILPINMVLLFKKYDYINNIFTVMLLLLVTYFSSRTIIVAMWGTMFILMVIYYVKWFRKSEDKTRKILSICIICILFIIMILLLLNLTVLSTKLYQYLYSRGIYNRSLRLMSEGKYISYSSGRIDNIYPKILNKIKEKPILGYGLGMDRVILEDLMYSHNLFLEICLEFGVIIGVIIILLIAFLVFRTLKSRYYEYIIAIIPGHLLILFLTASFLNYRGFWIILAIIVEQYIYEIRGKRI